MKNEVELKWYEKKRGIKLQDKIKIEKKRKEFIESQKREKLKSSFVNQKTRKNSASNILNKIAIQNFLFDEDKIPAESKEIIENFSDIVESTHPLNSKQKFLLPKQIRDLSHFLTDERGNRRMGYMNQTTLLTAYVHYFCWWNLVRLVRLFANIDKNFFNLKNNSLCLDIGSGPLTVPLAIYLACPELRNKNITFYCMDISQQAMILGENIFLSIAAKLKCTPWKIIRVKGELGTSLKEKMNFVTSANFFNELHDDEKNPPDFLAKKYTDAIVSYLNKNDLDSRCLVVEPGDPRSARLISLMRDSFMRKSFYPVAPCSHFESCPMEGKKGGKWCNFAFKTDNAPIKLKKLSEKAELPKERAILSFVAVCKQDKQRKVLQETDSIDLRIASGEIKLPGNRTGYYACSKKGLALVVTKQNLLSGQKISVPFKSDEKPLVDSKSGALILEI